MLTISELYLGIFEWLPYKVTMWLEIGPLWRDTMCESSETESLNHWRQDESCNSLEWTLVLKTDRTICASCLTIPLWRVSDQLFLSIPMKWPHPSWPKYHLPRYFETPPLSSTYIRDPWVYYIKIGIKPTMFRILWGWKSITLEARRHPIDVYIYLL